MIKGITLIISTILIFNSCKIKAQTDKRKELINSFVSAVAKYDTLKLYEIVDTSLYFSVQDKEDFLYTVTYLNKRFKECGSNIIDSSIRIKEMPVHSKQYIVPFCRGKNEVVVYDSFDLVFTFTEYGSDEKIRYIDVTKYRQSITPTIAPPPQQ